MKYLVEITGWAQDETFEDHAYVTAPDEDSAFVTAMRTMLNRWNLTFIEVGDCRIMPVDEAMCDDQRFEIAAELRNEQALADAGMY